MGVIDVIPGMVLHRLSAIAVAMLLTATVGPGASAKPMAGPDAQPNQANQPSLQSPDRSRQLPASPVPGPGIQLAGAPAAGSPATTDTSRTKQAAEADSETPEDAEFAAGSGCPLSHAINLGVTKALLRPPTNNPLDSFTYIAGIRCKEKGFLKQDTMIQSSIPLMKSLEDKGLRLEFAFDPGLNWSTFGEPSFTAMYITSIDLYTEKTGGMWPNGQFHATGAGWIGNSTNTGANNPFYFENPAPLNNWRIFELWYEHKVSPKFAVRLGKIYPWVKFASHQTSGIFQNMGFDFPGVYGSTTTTGNFLPYASTPLGIQLSYNPNRHHQILFHVMDGQEDPSGGSNLSLADLTINNKEGAEILAEYAYLDHSKDPNQLPGYYKIGFQGNTGEFLNFRTGVIERGNYGGYITLEKMLYAEPGTAIPRSQGLLGFMNFSGVAGENSVVNLAGSAGLTYAGLFPGRDQDMAGIGVAVTQFNPAAANYYAALMNSTASSTETVLEAVYLAQLTPWMMLTGSYQYIINPSAMGSASPWRPSGHVLLLGARLSL